MFHLRQFSRFVVVVGILITAPLSLAAQVKKDAKSKRLWDVEPDVLEEFKVTDKAGVVVDLGKDVGRNTIYKVPTTSSPFIVVTPSGQLSKLIDVRTGKAVTTFPQPKKLVAALLSLSPDGEYVAYGQMGGDEPVLAEIYSCKNGKLVATVKPEKDVKLEWVEFGPPGKLLVAKRFQKDEKTKQFDLEIRDLKKQGQVIKTFQRPDYERMQPAVPHTYAFSAKRKYLVLPSPAEKKWTLKVYDLEAGTLSGETVAITPNNKIHELAVSPNGKRLAGLIGGAPWSLAIFDMETGDFKFFRALQTDILTFEFAAVYGHYCFSWLGDNQHVCLRPGHLWNVDDDKLITEKKGIGKVLISNPSGQIVIATPSGLGVTSLK